MATGLFMTIIGLERWIKGTLNEPFSTKEVQLGLGLAIMDLLVLNQLF